MRIEFSGIYNAEHLRAADRLLFRELRQDHPISQCGCLGVCVFGFTVAGIMAASASRTSSALQWFAIGLAVAAALVWRIGAHKRALAANPLVGVSTFGHLDEQGINTTVADRRDSFLWSAFTSFQSDDNSIALFRSRREFVVLPRSFFQDEQLFRAAATLAQNKLGQQGASHSFQRIAAVVAAIVLAVLLVLVIIAGT